MRSIHGERDHNRPERTVYRITAEGRTLFDRWMREMLPATAREFPQFPAALAFLGLFSPDDVLRQLLVEEEYLHAMAELELRWVQAVIGELERGELQWDTEELLTVQGPGA